MLGRARLSSVSDWVQNQEITSLHKNISGSEASSLQILFKFWDFDIDPAQSWCQGWVKIANTKLSSMFDILQCIPMLDQAKQWWTAEERSATRQLCKFNPSQDTSATDSLVTLGSHGPETCLKQRTTQSNAVRQIWKAYPLWTVKIMWGLICIERNRKCFPLTVSFVWSFDKYPINSPTGLAKHKHI